MIIEANLDILSDKEKHLRQKTLRSLNRIRKEAMSVAHGDIPHAGESEDMRTFSKRMTKFSQSDIGNLMGAIENFADGLKMINNNYTGAQTEAITRALLIE